VEAFNEINESWDAMMVKAATTVNVIEVRERGESFFF